MGTVGLLAYQASVQASVLCGDCGYGSGRRSDASNVTLLAVVSQEVLVGSRISL